MNKEELIQMLKDNPIKIIKYGDIEIPVEYLKQTTVNVNGDDYIRLQQENKQLKDNWNELKKDITDELLKLREPNEYNNGLFNAFTYINNEIQELEQGSDSNE